MFSIRTLLPLLLIALISVVSHAKEAEDLEGFPKGPVKEVVKTVYKQDGQIRGSTITRFNRKGQATETIQQGQEKIRGAFTWNESNNIEKVLIDRNDVPTYILTFKYDDAEPLQDHFVSLSEKDVYIGLYRYKGQGNLMEYGIQDYQGQPIQREEYIRDEAKQSLEYKRYDSSDQLQFRVFTTYFRPNQILEEYAYKGEQLIHSRINRYNEMGKILESLDFNGDKTTNSRRTYTYDDQGYLLKEVFYLNGEINHKIINTYENNHRKKISQEGDGAARTEILYDDKGNETERITKNASSKADHFKYFYDDQNRKVKEENRQNDRLIFSYNISYNKEGNPLQELTLYDSDAHKQQKTTIYQYDSYGNMTERSTNTAKGDSTLSIPNEKVVWQYTYYEKENESRGK